MQIRPYIYTGNFHFPRLRISIPSRTPTEMGNVKEQHEKRTSNWDIAGTPPVYSNIFAPQLFSRPSGELINAPKGIKSISTVSKFSVTWTKSTFNNSQVELHPITTPGFIKKWMHDFLLCVHKQCRTRRGSANWIGKMT